MNTFFELSNHGGYTKIEPNLNFDLIENHFHDLSESFETVFNFKVSRKKNYSIFKDLIQQNGLFIKTDFCEKIAKVLGSH